MSKVDRFESIAQRELADILRNEVKDKLGFITITGIKITNELSFMYAYYTVLGKPEQIELTKEALERSRVFIKTQLASRLKLRKMPELLFKYDTSLDQGIKIDGILKKL